MKDRYKWKKCVSVLCMMALFVSTFSGISVRAEELSGQDGATERTEEAAENTADMEQIEEAAERISDAEVTEEFTERSVDAEPIGEATDGIADTEQAEYRTESFTDTKLEGEVTDGIADTELLEEVEESSADTEAAFFEQEITEENGEDTDADTENEVPPDGDGQDKKEEKAVETVSGNAAESEIRDTVSENRTSESSTLEHTISQIDISESDTDSEAESGAEVLTYTDALGNVFTYQADENGNITITGITVSGAALVIPEVIGEFPVTAVANESNCVVNNPETVIPELTINCHTIGTEAFSGLTIGTLTIGENVKELSVINDSRYTFKFYYEQFGKCSIEKVVFDAVELTTEDVSGTHTDDFYGPFYRAKIGSLEIGGKVMQIPERMFAGCVMELDTLEVRVERIGAYAFSSSDITIQHLILGEEVKLLEEFSCSSASSHYWEQFSKMKIGTLTCLANDLELGHRREGYIYNDFYGPFKYSSIDRLELGSNITRIPELFLHNANITIEELNLTQTSIGAYAFSGAGIAIGTLIFSEQAEKLEESWYSTELFHHWEQFSNSTIGCIRLYAPALELVKTVDKGTSSNLTIYAPFRSAKVGKLEIGNGVEVIPDYFWHDAVMELEELTVNVPVIGAGAFYSSGISIGTLTIGEAVTTFTESYFSKDLFHYWMQFRDCKIGHLVYKAVSAQVVNDVAGMDGLNPDFYGPFYSATIDAFTLDAGVTVIPDFLLMSAAVRIEELTLQMPEVGAMAFRGSNVSIGRLLLGEKLEVLHKAAGGRSSSQHWKQFAEAAIEEVHYSVPSLELEGESEYAGHCYGPFYESRIGRLYLSDTVERYPAYCFYGAFLEQEELAVHAKSIGTRAFSGSYISIGTLTVGTEVECFEKAKENSLVYYRQFADSSIGTLVYQPVCAATGIDTYRGVFHNTTIGNLVIDDGVEKIPDYLFYHAVMNLEDFTLNVPIIGCYSFSGDGIVFQRLTVGENVKLFLTDAKNYNRAFSYSTIGQLIYEALQAETETLSADVYGPFSYHTVINSLVIGDKVKEIPYGCFRKSYLDIEELTIENAAIGYAAFSGYDVKIGTLNIGKNVNYLGVVSNRLRNFQYATIGTLNYNSHAVLPEWSRETDSYGMFSDATISRLSIGEAVETIPAFWFRNAKMELEQLTLSCKWSYYAFYSWNISIGTLLLNGDMTEISHIRNRNMTFAYATIGTLQYEIPSAVYALTGTDGVYGTFYGTKITNLIVGETVEYLDYRLFEGNEISDCYVYPVKASENFLKQTLKEGYLPVCTNLHIHYNSDFKAYFSKKVTEYHWLCVDYFDTEYGDRLFDEETGEYLVEVFQTCRICGYAEEAKKELDSSYDICLSIPVEIPLVFDAEKKAYTGSETVYAYGTLGDAYEGICLLVETDSEGYGKAVMDGDTYDISSFLTAGFRSGAAAVFDRQQLTENAAFVENGQTQGLYQEEMTVEVDALAFLEGGAGAYQIFIPLRFEFRY